MILVYPIGDSHIIDISSVSGQRLKYRHYDYDIQCVGNIENRYYLISESYGTTSKGIDQLVFGIESGYQIICFWSLYCYINESPTSSEALIIDAISAPNDITIVDEYNGIELVMECGLCRVTAKQRALRTMHQMSTTINLFEMSLKYLERFDESLGIVSKQDDYASITIPYILRFSSNNIPGLYV